MEWISVKDRLPEHDDYCLVCLGRHIVRIGVYKYGHWHYCVGIYMTEPELRPGMYVTHWMPLPEPPKESAS